jgi:hypothetical protein
MGDLLHWRREPEQSSRKAATLRRAIFLIIRKSSKERADDRCLPIDNTSANWWDPSGEKRKKTLEEFWLPPLLILLR